MIKRIKNLISVKNLTASQFADLLGVQRSNISHILSGRNKPSLDFVLKISEHFPSISIEWLLKGQGEMFLHDDKSLENTSSQLKIHAVDTNLTEEIEQSSTASNNTLENKKDAELEISESASITSAVPAKGATEGIESSNLAIEEDGIEQIMVLYQNGSFRVYKPQK